MSASNGQNGHHAEPPEELEAPDPPENHLSGNPLTVARKRAFLAAFEKVRTVSEACRAVGLHRSAPYAWEKDDEFFRAAWSVAWEVVGDEVEAELLRNITEGELEPVVSAGKVVTTPLLDDQGRPVVGPDGVVMVPMLVKRVHPAKQRLWLEARRNHTFRRQSSVAIQHTGEVTHTSKPEELAPEYVANVLRELNSHGGVAPGAPA